MNLEYLRHGKALCGKVFRRFVETFNFHNDFISNLKGDADQQVVGGKIHLDRTDERHPVIRCKGCGVNGGAAERNDLGCYFISITQTEEVSFGNCWVQLAGKLYEGPSQSYAKTSLAGRFLVIIADVHSASGQTTFRLWTFFTFQALQEAQEDPDNLVIPLYKFDGNGAVECDFRTVPYEWQRNFN